jgi:hypothetical protein
MLTKRINRFVGALVVTGAAVVTGACGEMSRTGTAPVMLTIVQMAATAGGGDEEAAFLLSDVFTGGGVINDSGHATFRLVAKDPTGLGPSDLNSVTITRYHVAFVRADGRNTPGVDVPYAFDGGMTVTVPPGADTEGVYDLVRHSSKREPPLSNLRGAGAGRFINTIAQVTFYGHDQAGNNVEATGNIQVNFGDFADPEAAEEEEEQ